jgi:glycosyltransferase involved in cell wall biosynthesis
MSGALHVPPAAVPGNDWTRLPVPDLGAWLPSLPVTVVITYYQAPGALARTLAALSRQTYPAQLLEIVVVDDGSDPPLDERSLDSRLPTRVVHQEDRGFGLARARNHGAREATGDILLFLDCDMIPEPGWAEAHARWHHLASDVLTLGFRRHVVVDGITPVDIEAAASTGALSPLFEGRPQETPEWIEVHMQRTKELTVDDDDIFRVVTGGNLGVRKETFAGAGGYDESFTQWGAEDTEFGFRAYTYGALLVPERAAACWHQGLGIEPDPGEARSLEEQRAKISHLIADRTFRRQVPGRSFQVPNVVVELEAMDARRAADTIEDVLANRFHDLVVVVEPTAGMDGGDWLQRSFGPDPRVAIAGTSQAEAAGHAPIRLRIPDSVSVGDRSVGRMVDMLRSAGVLEVEGRPEWGLVGAKVRYLRRATRIGGAVTVGDLCTVAAVHAGDIQLASRTGDALTRRWWRDPFPPGSSGRKVWDRLAGIRSADDAGRFARWLAAGFSARLRRLAPGITRRLRDAGLIRSDYRPEVTHRAPGEPRPAAPGGTAVAVAGSADPLGEGAAWRGQATLERLGGRLDLIVTDTGDPVPAVPAGARLIRVSELEPPDRVPAFDVSVVRPVATGRRVGEPVALPADLLEAATMSTGSQLDGHVEDLARRLQGTPVRFPASDDIPAASCAAVLIRLAAAGLPVLVDRLDEAVSMLLGEELAEAIEQLSANPGLVSDPDERDLWAVRLRRAAARRHSRDVRLAHLREAAGLVPAQSPTVSVVLATNRPDHLPGVLESLSRQTVSFQLVVAVHDADPTLAADSADRAGLRDAEVIGVPGDVPLGEALNLASRRAHGRLITKVDDDDFYGPDHLFDLVTAHAASGAAIVGKGAEFVYLAGAGTTIRRFTGGAETGSTTIGGGALMVSADWLRRVDGWRPVPRRVDRGLIDDVVHRGGTVHRTHAFGYVLHRHGTGHTWEMDDRVFLDQAEARWPGLERRLTCLD